MDGYHYHFIGMHFFWWFFWLILIVPLFVVATPVRRKTARLYRDDPFSILQRRYAVGEITTDDYEDRKSRIKRDLADISTPPLSPSAAKR